MTEHEYWQYVRGGFKRIPSLHFDRIDNAAGSGIPDVNACYMGKEAWVELKVNHGHHLHFRNSQRGWVARRVQAGGTTFVLACVDNVTVLWPGPELVLAQDLCENVDEKSFKVDLRNPALPEKLGEWRKPVDWPALIATIFGINSAPTP